MEQSKYFPNEQLNAVDVRELASKAKMDEAFNKLSETALRVKQERDELLKTLKCLVLLLSTMRDLYEVDAIKVVCKQKSYTDAVKLLTVLCNPR